MVTTIKRVPLVLGTAIALVAALTACQSARNSAKPSQTGTANGDGSLSLVSAGLYNLAAPAGTFPVGERISIYPVVTGQIPNSGAGTFLETPLELSVPTEPAHPVVVTTAQPETANSSLTVGVLWDSSLKNFETLTVSQLADGRLTTQVPHFTFFGFLSFHNALDMDAWLAQQVVNSAVSFLNDFFDTPYDCQFPKGLSALLTSTGYPNNSPRLQVVVIDVPNQPNTVQFNLCNTLSLVMHYTVVGAGQAAGFSFPRSDLPINVALQGTPNQPVTLTGQLTQDALVATSALLALDALPSGRTVLAKVIKDGLLSSGMVTLLASAGQSCASAVNGALASPNNGGAVAGAVSCLLNLSTFRQAVVDLWTSTVVNLGLDTAAEAAAKGTTLGIILAGQSANRLLAEALRIPAATSVTFPYKLLCLSECSPPPATAPPSSPQQPAQSIDWRNTQYTTDCAAAASQPFTVSMHNGVGGVQGFNVSVDDVAMGDLKSDGGSETAVLLTCTPNPSNYSITEVQIFGNGHQRLATLRPPPLVAGATGPQPDFDDRPFKIIGHDLITGANYYAPGDCHAGGPTAHYNLDWSWRGRDFVATPGQMSAGPGTPC